MRRRTLVFAVVVAVMSAGLLGGVRTVQAKVDFPPFSVTKHIDTATSTLLANGSPGPEVILKGRLHLLGQPLFDGNTLIGYRLRSNLMNAFASSEDGMETYVAVGSSDGVPADCTEPCMPPSWTLTFRLVPRGPAGLSNLFFDLTVIPTYGPDGSVESICVAEQDNNCGVIP